MSRYVSKPGKHGGTLYLYRFRYSPDPSTVGYIYSWLTYAYNVEHAWEKWCDSNGDDGYDVDPRGPERVKARVGS